MIGRPGSGLVTLLEQTTFCISEASGDIRPGGAQGLVFRDTRFISRLELRLGGEPPEPVAVQPAEPFACTFLARRPPGVCRADSTLLVIRRRYVGNGMRDDITLRNLGREPAAAHLTVAVDGDFADLFEVKEGRARPHGDEDEVEEGTEDGALWLRCRRGANVGGLCVAGTGGPSASPGLLTWQVVIPHGGSWTASLLVTPSLDGQAAPACYPVGEPIERTAPARRLADWRRRSPELVSADERLAATFAVSAEDVGSLRIFGRGQGEQADHEVIAAGAPWFMTLFGRDSLLTSWMVLPLDPIAGAGHAAHPGQAPGRARSTRSPRKQPGRILHEIRSGLRRRLTLGGGDVYYGIRRRDAAVRDAARRAAPVGAGRQRRGRAAAARRPGAGLDRAIRRPGRGRLRRVPARHRPGPGQPGLEGLLRRHHLRRRAIAEPPIALAEVQGYVYAAYSARAHFARGTRRGRRGPALDGPGAQAQARFNEAFWLPDRGYFALGLDGDKRPIDALASNMGHCLWTGIVDEDKAAAGRRAPGQPADVHRVRASAPWPRPWAPTTR